MQHLSTIYSFAHGKVLAAIAVVLLLALGVTPSFAGSFVAAHDTIRITAAAGVSVSGEITVTDLLTHSISINASVVSGSTSLWQLNTSHITIGADTTHTGHFVVSINSANTGVYSGIIRLSDSVNSTVKYVLVIATITGNTNASGLHVYVGGTFLSTPVGTTVCRSVTVYYYSGDSVTVTLTGASLSHSSSVWSLSTDSISFPYTLTHGHYATFHVCYSPTAAGESVDTILVTYRDQHDSVRKGYAVLSGSGTVTTASSQLHVYVSGVFTGTHVDSTVCRPVFFYAAVDTGAYITLNSLGLTTASSLWSVNGSALTLPLRMVRGQVDTIYVCYNPHAVGESHDSIAFHYTDTHGASGVVYAALTGSATAPTANAQLHTYVYGSYTGTQLDSTICHPVFFYASVDTGTSLTLNSFGLTSPSSLWSVNGSAITLPLTMVRGQMDTIYVCFTPHAVGEYHDSIAFHFTDSHGVSGVVYAALVGTGVHSTSLSCFHLGGDTSSAYGAITAGTTQSRTMELANSTSQTWIITRYYASCDTGVWSITGLSLPDTLAPGAASHFTINFHAPSVTNTERYACLFQFYGKSSTTECEQGLGVRGYSTPDTSEVHLQIDTTQRIAFHASKPGSTYKYVHVRNNSGQRVKVEGISLTNTTYFSISLVSPDSTVPFYLSADGSLYLKLTLTDTSAGTYTDTLLITTENGLTSLSVPITADVSGITAGVAPTAAMQHFAIGVNPNPSRGGAITVSLGEMRHATVEVLDILGRVVWQVRDISNKYTWNGSTLSGGVAGAGAYIVRATGVVSSGASVTASTRFAIQK